MAGYQEDWGKEMDPKEHISTYDTFISATKWGTAATVIVLVLMAVFLL
ncbi:aa3-type cytochrome c oxidase subunit IV [Parvibaculum sp.]|jgi:hypothetical protein